MTDVRVRPCYVDGSWEQSASAGWVEVENPATETIIGRVPRCGAAEVERAVKAARRAFPGWRALTPHRRAEYLRAAGSVLAQRRDEVARTVTAEMGKPLDEARGEVDKVVRTLFFYAEEAVRVLGRTIPNDEPGFLSIVQREPIGVAAAIAPWNYPVELLGWKLGGGLAAGCTLVMKPASKTPMSAVALVECFDAARLPPGVVNLLTGDSRMGEALITHPDVDKIAFTGSQEVGERIFRDHGRDQVGGAGAGRQLPAAGGAARQPAGGGQGRRPAQLPEHGPDLRGHQPGLRAPAALRGVPGRGEPGGAGAHHR